jgi:hypothetical protein
MTPGPSTRPHPQVPLGFDRFRRAALLLLTAALGMGAH